MFTLLHLKSSRNDCFETIRVKTTQRNGTPFVLFNSRWYKVKSWSILSDNNIRYAQNYIGKFSTKDQFRIQFVEGV